MIHTATDPIPLSKFEHIPLSENALTVLRERYPAKDDHGISIEFAKASYRGSRRRSARFPST